MCWINAVASVAMQGLGIYQKNNSAAAMAEAQATGSYKSMNYAFQNYEIERQDAYDAAVNEITKTRINQMRLNSSVNAAIMEGYSGGGRTAARLMRAADADTSRAVSSIQDNYLRKSSEIDMNKEQTLLSTKDYIAGLKAQYKPNKWGDLISLAGTALGAYSSYRTQRTMSEAVGGGWDFWRGAVPKATGGGGGTGSMWDYIDSSQGPGMIAPWPQHLGNGFNMFPGASVGDLLIDPTSSFDYYYGTDGNLIEGKNYNAGGGGFR